jgi:hypothetical protein
MMASDSTVSALPPEEQIAAGLEAQRRREAWYVTRSELDAAKIAESGACVGFVQSRITRVGYTHLRQRFLAALDREAEAWDAYVVAASQVAEIAQSDGHGGPVAQVHATASQIGRSGRMMPTMWGSNGAGVMSSPRACDDPSRDHLVDATREARAEDR